MDLTKELLRGGQLPGQGQVVRWPSRWTPFWRSSPCAWRRTAGSGRSWRKTPGPSGGRTPGSGRSWPPPKPPRRRKHSPQRTRGCRCASDLERERDSLLQDIKALRRFRESFRQAVEEDAQSLLRQVEGLPSEKLL